MRWLIILERKEALLRVSEHGKTTLIMLQDLK